MTLAPRLASIRLSATAELEGCTNTTLASLPTLKLFQFSTALAAFWSMCSVLPFCDTVAPVALASDGTPLA